MDAQKAAEEYALKKNEPENFHCIHCGVGDNDLRNYARTDFLAGYQWTLDSDNRDERIKNLRERVLFSQNGYCETYEGPTKVWKKCKVCP